jgi:hypothetical protein
MTAIWYPGDRVMLMLPDGRRWRPDVEVTGTVRAVDDRGVYVDLDRMINGVNNCYATHHELTRINP